MADPQEAWGILGELSFKAQASPASVRFKQSVTLAELNRVEGKALHQWLGESLAEGTFVFSFDAGWCNPDDKLRELQKMMADHVPNYLGLGSGVFKGYYLIESLDITLQNTLPTGETMALSVQVKLTETEPPEPEEEESASPSPFVATR